jgi:hypothetical protein
VEAANVVDKLREHTLWASALAERHDLGPLSSRAIIGEDYVYTFARGVVRRLANGELRVESLRLLEIR